METDCPRHRHRWVGVGARVGWSERRMMALKEIRAQKWLARVQFSIILASP